MEANDGTMTSNRPYLLRAIYDWIVDNGLTPQVLVDAEYDQVAVPRQFVNDGRIVLNLSPSAVRNLVMGNDVVSFSARFGGQPFQVSIPPGAVRAVVARENGVGMSFPDADGGRGPVRSADGDEVADNLKAGNEAPRRSPEHSGPRLAQPDDGSTDTPPQDPPAPGNGPPRLHVVK